MLKDVENPGRERPHDRGPKVGVSVYQGRNGELTGTNGKKWEIVGFDGIFDFGFTERNLKFNF